MAAMPSLLLRGTILNPRPDGSVELWRDGALRADASGRIDYLGEASGLPEAAQVPRSAGVVLPPFLDAHIHIPQHPIRGRFMEGVGADPPQGRLLAGLERNVFPAEGRCRDAAYTQQVVRDFMSDTLAQGVVGGAAYMTVDAAATRAALELLPAAWSVGLVLMNMNCPEYLRSDEAALEADVQRLADEFGPRLILTDRFAAAVSGPLRRRAVALAARHGLRMQTHLAEQRREKQFVESLYPDRRDYTDVYAADGLLDHAPILAHCIQMSDAEYDVLADHAAAVAHCPTSNTLLGSGIMPLEKVVSRGIAYAICTDVGASPTTSMLAEMAQFLKVHARRHPTATPQEALYRATLAPAQMLRLDHQLGSLEAGRPCSFIEVDGPQNVAAAATADEAILALLGLESGQLEAYALRQGAALDALAAEGLDVGPHLSGLAADVEATARRLEGRVRRVVLEGQPAWVRPTAPAR